MFYVARLARMQWFRSLLVVLVLIAVIWLLGPLLGLGTLHPLETEIARYIAIAALVAIWIIGSLLQHFLHRRHDRKLASAISEPAPAEMASREAEKQSAEEIALLKDRLHQAMKALRKSKLGGSRKRLSAMPWYMIIGPPGAGKTTALQNCGLKFPLESAKQPLRGVGGTRNCEWMFTDEAVLIDTAGRYTTQDSAEAVDSAAWLGFLDMLKANRRRQPLNGVMVAISLSDLATQSEQERFSHARAIRHRIRELQARLGQRLPVYVLFTKADLIAGFAEFFDNLGKEDREQVWGATLPLDEGKEDDGAEVLVPAEFDLLIGRLNERMLERVHQEPDIRRRRLIYGFPQQVASLKDLTSEFLTEIFRPSRLEARPLLRGFYLTSGTQEGMAFDRMLGSMAAEFGLPRQAVTAPSGPGRSYFLSRLLKTVIFGEAAVAGLDPAVVRRERYISIGTYALCGLVLASLSGFWLNSYIGNRELIAQVHAGTNTYRALFGELQRRGAADQDMAATLPPLDAIRNIRGGYGQTDLSAPLELTFGLYQGTKLSQASRDAYVGALNHILLPRLLTRVEAQLAAHLDNLDFTYQTLKVYLILGRQGPLDRDLVLQWAQVDLLAEYPGEEETATRDNLLTHVDALLRQPLEAIALNTPLIAQARALLNKEPLAEYSYNRLLRSKRVTSIPAWTVGENGGPGAGRVFQYKSGRGLDTGLPGVYTWAGYHTVFLPLLPGVTQDITEDAWVLGRPKRDVQATLRDTNRLRRDVLGLYYDDYARRWDAMIADISIKPYTNVQQALDQLSLLSAPSSPLRDLMTSIDAQTQLSRPAATDAAVTAAEARGARVGQRAVGFAAFEARSGLSIRQNELTSIIAEAIGSDPSGKAVDPARRVDDHFRTFHDFVAENPSKASGLETAITRIQGIYQTFNQAASAGLQGQALMASMGGGGAGGQGGAAVAGSSPTAQLQEMARTLPPEVASILAPIARNATQVAASGASQEMADAWRAQVLPLCEAAFSRYPFVTGSSDDVPVDDFNTLLGPGGKVDSYFSKYLKPFVDTTSKPWRLLPTGGAALSVSAASIAEFEKAAQIRDGLFAGGSSVQVRFQLTPLSLDTTVGQVSVDVGGQTLTYAHGPLEGVAFTWPGPGGKYASRVTMTPTAGGAASIIDKDGPWALLRLLDGHIAGGAQPDKFRVTFGSPGNAAVFDLAASSVRNPFSLSALRSFRCPQKL